MIIDPSGRGPTMRQLVVAGVVLIAVLSLLLTLLVMRYQGRFEKVVHATAMLTTTGDGLPTDADVKYRGVLVGKVDAVEVAAQGEVQEVEIDLDPTLVGGIPGTVTARVVPSNIFAVTSVELLDNGPGTPLQEGAQIPEDRSKSTVALQSTLTSLRNILDRIDPVKLGYVIGTLSEALEPGGRVPGSTIARLDRWLTSVDAAIPDLGADLANFSAAAAGIEESLPELIDVLNNSVTTANTIATERANLAALLASAGGTIDVANTLFAANPNSAKVLVGGLNDVFGALAYEPQAISQTMANLNDSLTKLDTTFHWGPSKQMVWNIDVSFTPFKPYTRADCPRYGELAGPSCATAPVQSNPGVLPPELRPRRLDTAGPEAVAPPVPPPAAPIPALPQLPTLPPAPPAPAQPQPPQPQPPLPQLPQLPLPQLPLPQLPLPQLPGITPANATTPAAVRPGGL
ncbi:MAG: MCE family protein, partial [Aldersonia sp.]|nr:MCE family protein [Aldersonia sp.]